VNNSKQTHKARDVSIALGTAILVAVASSAVAKMSPEMSIGLGGLAVVLILIASPPR